MVVRVRLAGGVAALALTALPAAAQSGRASLELFEDAVPAGMTAGKGDLTISADHYKDGRHSLKWSFAPGGTLTIARPFAFAPFVENATDQRRPGIAFWIYNPVRSAGAFRFDFYRGTARAAGFTLKADFTGWRAAVLSYETDMSGTAVAGMDRLVVTPPQDAGSGQAYFDQMGFDMLIDPRHPAADYQLPGVNAGVADMANAHWTAVLKYDDLLRAGQARWPQRPVAATATTDDVAAVAHRIDADLIRGKAATLPAIEEGFRALHNPDGSLKALAQTSQQWEMYRANGIGADRLKALRASSMTWRELGRFLRTVAVAFRKSASPADRQRLQSIFRELVRHQADQGLVRGSGQGILHHQGYQIGEWTEALFLMRDALGEDADTARQAMAWFTGLGRIYEPRRADADFNADVMNTLLQPMLFSILMDGDGARRQATLFDFRDWIGGSVMVSPGTGGGIKPDGSMFHHSQHYVAYGNGALTGLTGTIYYLSGTGFGVGREATDRVRHAVLTTRLLSSQGLIPLSLSGRHLDGEQAIAIAPFRYMALAGTADNAGPDREMAGAFLRLVESAGNGSDEAASRGGVTAADRAAASDLRRAGAVAEADPTGSWTMNYSSLVLHRRDGWLIGARGFSRYLVGNEAYDRKNLFGRYVNYGALEFLPADMSRRGFAREGWDWTRWPGTTALHIPLDRLRARVAQVDAVAGVEEMLLSEQSFSGGLDFRGRQAMFAMKLQGHPKYADDLVARKSYFFFDDRVVALGSGISASDPSAPVQTTVFQDRLRDGGGPAAVAGEGPADTAAYRPIHLSGWRSAVDEGGNGICLAPRQDITFRRGEQVSRDETGATETRGRFATLVIDHGVAPKSAGYEYVFLPAAGAGRARSFCDAMSGRGATYSVLSRSDRAHIVRDAATGLTGYALFEAGAVDAPGPLIGVSSPSMLMLRAAGRTLEGAFVNPDLNFYQGTDPGQYDAAGWLRERSVYALPWRMSASKPVPTTVRFRGRWRLDRAAPDIHLTYDGKAKATTIVFDAVDAQPIQFKLLEN